MTVPDDRVRIAIIGVGAIGPRHAQSVSKCADAVLTAFVDPSQQAVPLATRFNVHLFKTLHDLLVSDHKPEAAIVCTPNSTHVSLSEQLLKAGVHVLVEKPVSTDVMSGQRLAQTVAESDMKLLVGHHRRFNPYVVAAKQALSDGAIGKPIAVSGLWSLCKPSSYFEAPTAWRASAEVGGPISINLIHDIDILIHLLGPIVRVYAEQTVSQREHDAEEGAAIVLRFASGVVGTFLLSDATPSPHSFESGTGENPIIPRSGKDFYRIFGSKGTLSVGDMSVYNYDASQKRDWSNALKQVSVRVDEQVPFDEQVKHFVRVVRGQEKSRCTVGDGLDALRVTEAVREALRTGLPVNLLRAPKL